MTLEVAFEREQTSEKLDHLIVLSQFAAILEQDAAKKLGRQCLDSRQILSLPIKRLIGLHSQQELVPYG